jgi:hypothetical protein
MSIPVIPSDMRVRDALSGPPRLLELSRTPVLAGEINDYGPFINIGWGKQSPTHITYMFS